MRKWVHVLIVLNSGLYVPRAGVIADITIYAMPHVVILVVRGGWIGADSICMLISVEIYIYFIFFLSVLKGGGVYGLPDQWCCPGTIPAVYRGDYSICLVTDNGLVRLYGDIDLGQHVCVCVCVRACVRVCVCHWKSLTQNMFARTCFHGCIDTPIIKQF